MFISHANGWFVLCMYNKSLVNDKTCFMVDVCFVVVLFVLVSFEGSVVACSLGG